MVKEYVLHWLDFKTLNNYLSDFELFLLLCVTVSALNGLYYVEWFVLV